MPLWTLSLVTIGYMLVLVHTHKRMALWVKLSLVIPAISLVCIYTIFSVYEVNLEFRQNAGRMGQAIMLVWYIILLLITRKQHAGVYK